MRKITNPGIIILAGITFLGLFSCNMPSRTDQPVPTSVPTSTPLETSTAVIRGVVWHDLCALPGEGQPVPEEPPAGCQEVDGFIADGVRDPAEPGIQGLFVTLGSGPCPSVGLETATTDDGGEFAFRDLSSGTYCLSVDPRHPQNEVILIPGEWTSRLPDADGVVRVTIELDVEDSPALYEFGWDYQFLPVYEVPTPSTPSPTPTESITPTATPTATVTPTPRPEDSSLPKGNPAWQDDFSNGDNWYLYTDTHVSFEVEDGKAIMTAFNPDYWDGWMLSWPEPVDLYLEAVASTQDCTGPDRYGLVIRSVKADDNYIGYLFGVTCDGRYSLRSWDGEEFTTILDWTASTHLNPGSDQTNRIGIKAEGENLALYANGQLLAEVEDSTHTEGKFGLFIGAAKTEDFTIEIDKIAYWSLP